MIYVRLRRRLPVYDDRVERGYFHWHGVTRDGVPDLPREGEPGRWLAGADADGDRADTLEDELIRGLMECAPGDEPGAVTPAGRNAFRSERIRRRPGQRESGRDE